MSKNLLESLYDTGVSFLTHTINATQAALDDSYFNRAILTPLTSALDSALLHETPSTLAFLDNTTQIPVPSSTETAQNSPTVSQFLNAANAEYTFGSPTDLKPFLVGGLQLSETDAVSGMSARVWVTDQDKVIIAFAGTTGGLNLFANPVAATTQTLSNISIYGQTVTAGEKDAVAFTRYVAEEAAKQGIDSSSIYLTGHSLGGIEASYVAQQTGLGGMSFESTGIPVSATTKGDGKNFASVVTYGDPVGNYGSDIKGEQPFAPAYDLTSGKLPHYGEIFMIGDPANQAAMSARLAGWHTSVVGDVLDLSSQLANLFALHLPSVEAAKLGVTLSPTFPLGNGFGNMSGPTLNVGNDTIAQLLASNHGAQS